MKNILFQTVLVFLFSCNSKMDNIESPLATIIKLNDAESIADLKEARKYIDVEKTYSTPNDSSSGEKIWKDYVMFNYNLSKDKKFNNLFKYFNYEIEERINGNKAEVLFISLDHNSNILKIIYHLEILKNKWIVIGIHYIKNDTQ